MALTDPSGLRRQMGPVLLMTVLFFFNFSGRVIFAPLLPEIEKELGISHLAAGSLFFLISSGYVVALLGSGWVAARITHRRTIIVSSVALGLALWGTVAASGLWPLRAALLLLGAAAGLYLPSAMATLTGIIQPESWGKAIAVHELAPNLGFVAAPLLVELGLMVAPWQMVPAMLGVFALILGVLFARYGRGGDFAGAAPGLSAFRPFMGDPAFWIVVSLFALGISSTLGIFAMLPLYLVNEIGIDRNVANTIVSLSRASGLFMALAGGWAADRYGPAKTMVAVFMITGLCTVGMGVLSDRWVVVAVFVQPMAAVCFFPAGFAALSGIGPAGSRNIAISLGIPIAFLVGGGAVPTVIGFLGDVCSFSAGITLVGLLIGCGSLLALRLR